MGRDADADLFRLWNPVYSRFYAYGSRCFWDRVGAYQVCRGKIADKGVKGLETIIKSLNGKRKDELDKKGTTNG